MFSVDERARIRDRILTMARGDARIVSGAEVGGMAGGVGDRWSDVDLSFGVARSASIDEVLADWTDRVQRDEHATHLFDVSFRSSIYRVFLFPGNLQVDLSFTPEHEFGAFGPNFTLLFGATNDRPHVVPASPHHLFGLGVHHAVRAHVCIERGRGWQALHWIDGVRDQAIALACRHRGLETANARGADRLPQDVRDRLLPTLVRSIDPTELRRALVAAIDALLENAQDVHEVTDRLASSLRELGSTAPR
jgi:hypothetical protein